LDYDDIKKLNTLLLDDSNISGLMPLSKFYNWTDSSTDSNIYKFEDELSKNEVIIDCSENMSVNDEESSEENNSEKINENLKNLFDLDNLNENKDFYFNIQKFINSYDLV